MEAKILNATRKPPTDGFTQWSTRRLIAYTAGEHHGSLTVTEERYVADHAVEATVVIAVHGGAVRARRPPGITTHED